MENAVFPQSLLWRYCIFCVFVLYSEQRKSWEGNFVKPVKIIFDTDIGWDCDDAGTLAMLHRLCDKGEAELLAVTHCFATPYLAG